MNFLHARKISSYEVFDVVHKRVEALRKNSFAELASLPSSSNEKVALRKCEIAVCTWRDTLSDGSVRIVAQAYLHWFLGIGTMTADGFIVTPDGKQNKIPEEMLREFS